MSPAQQVGLLVPVAYLLGSIPAAYVAGKAISAASVSQSPSSAIGVGPALPDDGDVDAEAVGAALTAAIREGTERWAKLDKDTQTLAQRIERRTNTVPLLRR